MTGPTGGPAPTREPLYLRRPLLAGFLRQWPLAVVILAVGVGLALVAVQQWRVGLVVMGLALVLAGLLRLLLPVRRIGFLAVRSRPVDITLMLGAGAVLVLSVLTIPHT